MQRPQPPQRRLAPGRHVQGSLVPFSAVKWRRNERSGCLRTLRKTTTEKDVVAIVGGASGEARTLNPRAIPRLAFARRLCYLSPRL